MTGFTQGWPANAGARRVTVTPPAARAKASRHAPENRAMPSPAEVPRAVDRELPRGIGGRWPGSVIVCMASGPSLSAQDCERVERWRLAPSDRARRVIVVNTTYQAARWADILYAMDSAWWRMHGGDVAQTFRGERVSAMKSAAIDVQVIPKAACQAYGNSGAGAVSLAAHMGATRILLLGYDSKRTGGKVHWHGDHPKGLGNAGAMGRWPAQFANAAAGITGAEIINCSRETVLTCWPRGDLEAELCRA